MDFVVKYGHVEKWHTDREETYQINNVIGPEIGTEVMYKDTQLPEDLVIM